MIVAEFLALCTFLTGIGLGISVFAAQKKFKAQMRSELVDALVDYEKLSVWLIVYADEITPAQRKKLEQRLDDLYIEAHNRK